MTTNNGLTRPAADILIVDDEIGSRWLLTEILSKEGYRVRPADGPQVALESALAHPPSLILLDVRMPELSGFEVGRRLKQDERTREIPIIFVSALQDVDDRVRGFEVGGVDFVSKPFQEAEVLARVKTHLQLREMRLNLEGLVAERTAELTRTNEALKASEEKFRTVVENAKEGILVMQDGQRKYYNPHWLGMTGYTAEEYENVPFLSLVHPDDLDTVSNYYQNLLKVEDIGDAFTFRILTKSGDEKWLAIRVSTIPWEDKLAGMVFIEDITERKRVEENLRKSEERFHSLFVHMLNSIALCEIIVDENNMPVDFIYLEVNDAFEALTGLRREGVLGKKASEVFPGTTEEYPDLIEAYGRVALTGVGERFDIEFKPLNIWLSISVFSTQKGHFTTVFENITERIQAEKEVLEYQQRLKALASQLTLSEERERRRLATELHDEVGQTLAFARMRLASAQKATSAARRDAILEDVSQSLRQAIDDTRDLVFDLSSPLLNELGLAAALSEWLEEQVSKKHGLQAKLINGGKRLQLEDDMRAVLFRCARELLSNVVKHAQAKSVIVRLECEGALVRIFVEDDGIGFDVDAIPEATKREGGFGLFSILEGMADLGGSLEIASEPGQGCTAILTAPTTINQDLV